MPEIRYLRARLGTWVAADRAVRIKRAIVRRVRDGGRVRPYVARKVASIAAISVEDSKAGKYPGKGAFALRTDSRRARPR